MSVVLAVKTKQAIDSALASDQGALFRRHLHAAMKEAVDLKADAFREEEDGLRSHLGASLLGRDCGRELWYSFRWFTAKREEARMVRLFNRGHLEEPRFVAMLRMIGCTVWQYDDHNRQFRVAAHNGHFGGSLDSVVKGCPDMPDIPVLGEFKTHNDKSFEKLVKVGVREAKFPHWVQKQIYMSGYQLTWGLYLAVNKNNDEIYAELVPAEPEQASQFYQRAGTIISAARPPRKISPSPGWYGCKLCDHQQVCHHNADPNRTCRSCIHSRPVEDGKWICIEPSREQAQAPNVLSKEDQRRACPDYRWIAT